MKNRNFGLDAIRAFSILLVLTQHAGLSIGGLKVGALGVEIFFVLSGYLIGGILVRELKKENSVTTLKRFWIRRWFRILPLYYFMLLIKFIFIDHSIGWNILYYVFFLQNNFYGINYYDVSWSLVIEEWFYLFVPLFIMILYRFFKHTNSRLAFFFLFLLAEIILRFLYVKFLNPSFDGIHSSPLFRLDSLFYGVIAAYIKQEMPYTFKYLRKKAVFFIGLLLFFSYTFYRYYIAIPSSLINNLIFPRTLGFSVFSFSIVLMVPFIDSFEHIGLNNIFKKGIYYAVSYISLFTYSIYLIHPFVFHFFFTKTPPVPNKFLNGSSAFLITFILAAITYNLIEHPILKLRERFK